jgi:hypothetical protein
MENLDPSIIHHAKPKSNFQKESSMVESASRDFSDEISLKDIVRLISGWWKYLLSKWIFILIAVLVGGTAGYIYAHFKKTIYIAEFTFVLEGGNQGGGMGSYAGLASQFGINMGGAEGQGVFQGENFLVLVKSRTMVEKALLTTVTVDNKPITLAEFYISINKLRDDWVKKNSPLKDVRFLPNANPAEFSIVQNSLISGFHSSIIGNNLFIDKKDKKSGIISLLVKSENELFSKYFAEVLAKEVSEFYIETKTKKSVENLKILQQQTDSIRRALDYSMVGAAISMDANPNPNPARQILRVPSQQRQGEAEVNQIILGQLVQNLEISKMSLRTETPLIQVIDRPILPLPVTAPNKFNSMLTWGVLSAFIMGFFLVIKKLLAGL